MQHTAVQETTITDVPGLEPRFLEVLDETIREYVERGEYHGANVVVARHGEIALRGSYGLADLATGRPTRPDDVYRILSMSKGFTNALVYRALSEGRLMLSTRVVDLFSVFFQVRDDVMNLDSGDVRLHFLSFLFEVASSPNPPPHRTVRRREGLRRRPHRGEVLLPRCTRH